MRLYYNGRTIEDLKKYLEEKVRDEELRKLMEEKDKKESRRVPCPENKPGCLVIHYKRNNQTNLLDSNFQDEELKELMEQKDKEDEKAMREYMFQNDNQSFSG